MVAVQKTKINHGSGNTSFSLKAIVLAGLSVISVGAIMFWKLRTDNKEDLYFVGASGSLLASSSPTSTPLSSEEITKHIYFNPLESSISKLLDERPKRFCPCCGWSGKMFAGKTFSGVGKIVSDRRCPRCRTLERHRKACGMLGCSHNHTILASRVHEDTPFRLLHFGPEKAMMKYIDSFLPSIDQVGVDYFASGYTSSRYDEEKTLHADVTDLKFPDNFANGIIILHVLEHIPALETAIKELIRVLAPGGWAMIEVPCMKDGETKDCRHFKNSTEDLIKCAGQRDHVWKFNCMDFKNRLEKSGMKCEAWYQLDHQKDCLDSDLRKSILPTEIAINVPTLLCRHGN